METTLPDEAMSVRQFIAIIVVVAVLNLAGLALLFTLGAWSSWWFMRGTGGYGRLVNIVATRLPGGQRMQGG